MVAERQPISPEALRQVAALAGLAPSEAELAQLAPQLEALYEALARLGELELRAAEPAVIFPMRQE